ncbi:MAG TPA: CHAT domain-containing protein [Bryobacteraceae bacterium]|jgi:hypothetical protein|nr:CHAT domain-containing protein [Bryobacteraceae bacterium]
MASSVDLGERVVAAESLWLQGKSALAYEAFRDLFLNIISEHGVADFNENEFLITQRYGDLAAERGHMGEALALYAELHRTASSRETRARAAFKRLYLAVEAGEPLFAHEAYTAIWSDTGLQPIPADATESDLIAWENGVGWRISDRAALFSLAYLALGRVFNALRWLKQSLLYLKRGLSHTEREPAQLARITGVPLRLALAGTHLAMGSLSLCRGTLDETAEAIEKESSAAAYAIWLAAGKAKVSLFEGRFSETLDSLRKVQSLSEARSLDRPYRAAVLGKVEVFIIMNEVQEARALLENERNWAIRNGDRRTLEQIARLEYLCTARSGMFDAEDGGPPPLAHPGELRSDETVWTGDCLRDYERRETLVYAMLDSAPKEARRDLRDLWQDYENVESSLIQARLNSLSGLLLARNGDSESATEFLGVARHIFRQIGAERELYQTTAHLIFTIEKSDPERYSRLIEENDLRLARFTCGLTVEQRNALLLNKYTAEDQILRQKIEKVQELRGRAQKSSWSHRAAYYWRYWKGLHNFLCRLEDKREGRRTSPDAEPAPRQNVGKLGFLRRLVWHRRRDLTVGYVVLPDLTFVYSVRRWALDCQTLALGRMQIAEQVLDFRARLFSGDRAFDDLSGQLCRTLGLSELLKTAPRRVRHLTIVPDGELRRLPFCALRRQRSDNRVSYLVQDFTLSLYEAGLLARRSPQPISGAVAGYTVRGLNEAAATSKDAADRLRCEWRLNCTLSEDKSAFLQGIPGAGIIYYFGHGHFHLALEDHSGLEFMRPAGVDLLTLGELNGVDFGLVDQAVILACHGSDARTFPGRWTVSLPEMLLRRGARSVLASMWLLQDGVAKDISDCFLREAPTKGRAAAVASVQRALISGRRKPFDWAGLYIYGEPGPIRLAKRSSLWRFRK